MSGPLRLAFLLLTLLITLASVAARPANHNVKNTRSIDCRRYVFHPQCRGVAKRTIGPLQESLNQLPQLQVSPLQLQLQPILPRLMESADDNPTRDADSVALLLAGPDRLDHLDRLEHLERLERPEQDSQWDGAAAAAQGAKDAPSAPRRYDWLVYRKRVKEPEISYDY